MICSLSKSIQNRTQSSMRFLSLALFGALALTMTGSIAVAQDEGGLPYGAKYEYVEVDEGGSRQRAQKQANKLARAARRDGEKAVQAILSAGGDVNVPATQEYFDGYVFPSMTKPKNLTNAGKLRYDFDRAYMGTKFLGGSRVAFIENIALPGLKKLVDNDELIPAARVNATVMISRLDDAPLVRTSKTPPRPSLRAFDTLITIWRGDYPDFVKATALAGIVRHMEVDNAINTPRIPNDRKNQLMTAVISSVDAILADDPELKADLNRWTVTKSIDLMGNARLTNEAANYFDRLTAMLAEDSKIPQWVRLEAVRNLSRIPLDAVASEKINGMIELATLFASQSIQAEAKDLEKRVEDLIYDNILWGNVDLKVTGTDYTDNPTAPAGGGGMGGGMGGMGGGMGGPGGMGGDGPGGMGGMGGDGPGGMGGFTFGEDPPEPIVELPNFELNMSRRRMKLVAFTVRQLLDMKPIKDRSTEAYQAELAPLGKRLSKFIDKDSNIGIVDLSKKKDDDKDPQRTSYSMQLKEACEGMALELRNSVAKMRGEAQEEVAPAGPAGDGPAEAAVSDPFNAQQN